MWSGVSSSSERLEIERNVSAWREVAWLIHRSLHKDNVMDYFSLSPFYDSTCTRERLAAQNVTNGKLENMIGTEYILDSSSLSHNPITYYIIREQYRVSPEQSFLLNLYYISAGDVKRERHEDGVVIKLPDLQTLLRANLSETLYQLSGLVSDLRLHIEYNSAHGYLWNFDPLKQSIHNIKKHKVLDGETIIKSEEESKKEEEALKANNPYSVTNTLKHIPLSVVPPLMPQVSHFDHLATQSVSMASAQSSTTASHTLPASNDTPAPPSLLPQNNLPMTTSSAILSTHRNYHASTISACMDALGFKYENPGHHQ